MTRPSTVAIALVGFLSFGTAAPARADDARPEADPVRRLDGWLEKNHDRLASGRILGGVSSVVTGVLTTGLGVLAYASDESDALDLLGLGVIGLTPLIVTSGILLLAMPSPQEDRYERWTEARRHGVDPVVLARFEGEFRAEVELSRYARTLGGYLGVTTAVSGCLFAGLAASSGLPDDQRVYAISFGGGLALGGLLVGILAFVIQTPIEDDWADYRAGLTPVR